MSPPFSSPDKKQILFWDVEGTAHPAEGNDARRPGFAGNPAALALNT